MFVVGQKGSSLPRHRSKPIRLGDRLNPEGPGRVLAPRSRGTGMGWNEESLGVDLLDASSSHPPLAFEGLKVRSDLELVRPIVSKRW